MILAIGLSIPCHGLVRDNEFDNKVWNLIAMNWETINDTWEEEL